MRSLLLLLAALALALPTGAVELAVQEPGSKAIPTDGSMELVVDVTATCQEIISAGGTIDAEITATDAPAGVTVAPGSVELTVQECIPDGSVTKNTTLAISAGEDAVALDPFTLTLSTGDATATAEDLFVAYAPGHTLTPGGDQTFQVTNDTYEFDLVIDVTANGRTMVMFEDKNVSDASKLDGLRPVTFDVGANQTSMSLPIKFTAPPAKWDNVTVTFRNLSHCVGAPEEQDCSPTLQQNITWTFVNAAASNGGGGDKKDSPIGLVALVGIAVAVFVARRR